MSLPLEFSLRTLWDLIYGTESRRNLDKEFDYPAQLTTASAWKLYDRCPVSARVVEAYPEGCWEVIPQILQRETAEKRTEWETKTNDLLHDVGLWDAVQHADVLAGIETYAVVVLHFDDVRSPDDLKNPPKNAKILAAEAFAEKEAKILSYVTEAGSEMGAPLLYSIVLDKERNTTLQVHRSRVLHVSDKARGGTRYKSPSRLLRVLNALLDITKITGGSAEMVYRSGVPQTIIELAQGGTIKDPEKLDADIRKFQDSLVHVLALSGAKPHTVAPHLADARPNFEIALDLISLGTGIPRRILLRSARQGSSSAGASEGSIDDRLWQVRLKHRRTRHLTPNVIKPLLKLLTDAGALSAPADSLHVEWKDSELLSVMDMAEYAMKVAQAIAMWFKSGAGNVFPPRSFFSLVMHLPDDMVDRIMEEADRLQKTAAQVAPTAADAQTPPGGSEDVASHPSAIVDDNP